MIFNFVDVEVNTSLTRSSTRCLARWFLKQVCDPASLPQQLRSSSAAAQLKKDKDKKINKSTKIAKEENCNKSLSVFDWFNCVI